jgi:DMSO/TMAO reductase YedYZ molybdopterin-dependent catalytic subunit
MLYTGNCGACRLKDGLRYSECAGNSRVFLVPQVEGAQWEPSVVGNAEWTGVPFAALLERVGLEEDACEIVLEGADRGVPKEPPLPPTRISYARSLPRTKQCNGKF